MEKKERARTIGKYEIVSRIGQGGMATAYKARHPTLGRAVLLKRMALHGGSQFTERFKREATLLMDFKHDAIVQVYDHFKEGSYYYLVEEFVDGLSLEDLIRRERYLSNEAAVLLLYEVCRALKYAHDKGVVHRDVKPANILISHKGEVKLVDFGIASSASPAEGQEGLTRDGMTLGTPAYIPPEQIGDARNADKRADIYSLGVVAYEALTGKTPFPGAFNAETIRQIQKGRYVPPARLNPRISPLLRRIIRKCIRPKRRRRFQDLRPVLRLLGKRIRRRDPASIRDAIRRLTKGESVGDSVRPRGRGLAWALAALVLVAGLAGAGIVLARRGAVQELLLADRYGALVAAVRVPPGYKPPQDVAVRAVLYSEKGSELQPGPALDLGTPAGVPAGGGSPGYTLESGRLYLPEGRYRLKVTVDGQIAWTSFFLRPRVVQRRNLDTIAAQRVEVAFVPIGGLPLTVRTTVRDVRTGVDLTASTLVSVARGFEWLPLTPEAISGLRSGGSYRFRFERSAFDPQIFAIAVGPYESRIAFEVALVPVAGTLSVTSESEGVSLLLDDSATYLAGGSERGTRPLPSLGTGTRELTLDPGEYRLTARRGGDSRTVAVTVTAGETTRVRISQDRSTRELLLRVH